MADKDVMDTKRSFGHGILQHTCWTSFDEVEEKVEEEGVEEVKEAVEIEEEIGKSKN